MDGVREFLDAVRQQGMHVGRLRALLHVVIGRRIAREDGTEITQGATWREAANALRLLRWDREQAREVGEEPENLPPRDRQRYWYAVIRAAGVDTDQARAEGDDLAQAVRALGFIVAPPPGRSA